MPNLELIINLSLFCGFVYLFFTDLVLESAKAEPLELFSIRDGYDVITVFLTGALCWPILPIYLIKIVIASIVDTMNFMHEFKTQSIQVDVFNSFLEAEIKNTNDKK